MEQRKIKECTRLKFKRKEQCSNKKEKKRRVSNDSLAKGKEWKVLNGKQINGVKTKAEENKQTNKKRWWLLSPARMFRNWRSV